MDKIRHERWRLEKNVYSHLSEPREAGEGQRADILQHVVPQYEATVGGSGEKRERVN